MYCYGLKNKGCIKTPPTGERNLIGRRSVYDDKTLQTEQKKIEGVSKL